MFQRHQQRAIGLLAVADLILATGAFEAAYWTRTALPMREFHLEPASRILVQLAVLAAVFAAGHMTGAYTRLSVSEDPPVISVTARQAVVAALPLLAFLYLLNLEVPVSRLFLALLFAYLALLQCVQRGLAARFRGSLRRALGAVTSVVVVGDGEKALQIARELEASERHGLRLQAVVGCEELAGQEAQLAGSYPIHPLDALPGMLNEQAIDEVIFALSSERLRQMEEVFVLCDEHGVMTRIVADFFPLAHSRLHFDRFGEHPLLTFSIAPADDFRLLVKRGFDAVFSFASLFVLAVPMSIVSLLVKLTSTGPVFFRQRRCGLNGRLFTCYKFRSMVVNAEARRHELEHLNEKDGPAFKIRDDPRLTPVGSFLRRYSIDEWPQFWNVLRGDMSLVGPRPAVPAEVSQYEIWQRRRLRMRPGLTCLWAVRGRDRLEFDSWMQMDLEYIDQWSLWLDAKILALSVPVVLAGKGAS